MAAEDQEVSITPLLRRIWPSPAQENVTAGEIAIAISHIFTNRLSAVQTGALLTALHFTGWDRRADVIAQCAAVMRAAASPVDQESLYETLKRRGRVEGNYGGRVVGTHSTQIRSCPPLFPVHLCSLPFFASLHLCSPSRRVLGSKHHADHGP